MIRALSGTISACGHAIEKAWQHFGVCARMQSGGPVVWWKGSCWVNLGKDRGQLPATHFFNDLVWGQQA